METVRESIVKKKLNVDTDETSIKFKFNPTDTVQDVNRNIREKISEIIMI